jgi:hypothetical protein
VTEPALINIIHALEFVLAFHLRAAGMNQRSSRRPLAERLCVSPVEDIVAALDRGAWGFLESLEEKLSAETNGFNTVCPSRSLHR